MNTLVLLLICIAILACGYIFYGRWLCKQWGVGENDEPTPAHTLEDGVDYVPAKAPVLMGHHFSSIAGAGPITGPIGAAIFGWVPVVLWVLVGGIFFGGVHDFGASPMLTGRGSYLASVAANFLFRKIGRRWRVTLDDEVIEDTFALVSMCNGRYYGGGSTPVPEARMTDGVLHTVLVKNVSKARFATLFGGYSAGDYKKLPQDIIRVSTAKVVRIEALEGDLTTCLDGESLHSQCVTLKLADKKVNFFAPKGCDPDATAR